MDPDVASIDSEDEEQLAYDMFIDDIDQLRKLMIKQMHFVMAGQTSIEDKFA
jgi:hypothetical protein